MREVTELPRAAPQAKKPKIQYGRNKGTSPKKVQAMKGKDGKTAGQKVKNKEAASDAEDDADKGGATDYDEPPPLPRAVAKKSAPVAGPMKKPPAKAKAKADPKPKVVAVATRKSGRRASKSKSPAIVQYAEESENEEDEDEVEEVIAPPAKTVTKGKGKAEAKARREGSLPPAAIAKFTQSIKPAEPAKATAETVKAKPARHKKEIVTPEAASDPRGSEQSAMEIDEQTEELEEEAPRPKARQGNKPVQSLQALMNRVQAELVEDSQPLLPEENSEDVYMADPELIVSPPRGDEPYYEMPAAPNDFNNKNFDPAAADVSPSGRKLLPFSSAKLRANPQPPVAEKSSDPPRELVAPPTPKRRDTELVSNTPVQVVTTRKDPPSILKSALKKKPQMGALGVPQSVPIPVISRPVLSDQAEFEAQDDDLDDDVRADMEEKADLASLLKQLTKYSNKKNKSTNSQAGADLLAQVIEAVESDAYMEEAGGVEDEPEPVAAGQPYFNVGLSLLCMAVIG